MQTPQHLEDLRRLREDPRAMQHFIHRAHQLRARAFADVSRQFVRGLLSIFDAARLGDLKMRSVSRNQGGPKAARRS